MEDRHARHRRADADRRRRPSDGHRSRDRRRFARLVADAIAGVPPPLLEHLERITVAIDDVPAAGTQLSVFEPGRRPASEAGTARLVLYRRPLELRAGSKADLVDLVLETLVHELTDQFGSDDEPEW